MCSVPGVPTPGSEVSVLITRVNLNPNCGLVELWVNMNNEIKHVYEQMREDIQIPTSHFCESEGKPGDLCLVHADDTWHRARVVSVQNETYGVFLIDQGQPHSTTGEALAWGKDECFILPPEIESCVLANVLSIENNWPDRATNFLKSLPGKEFKGLVQHALMPDRTILLDIPTVSKHLCKAGVVKKIPVDEFKSLVLKCLNLPKEDGPESCQITKEQRLNVSNQLANNDHYFYPELLTSNFETVRVTEVIDPQNIFCELVIFSKAVKILSKQINEDCEDKSYETQSQPETFGAPCAAKGLDGGWRRALLRQHIASKDDTVQVLFVDEGKTQLIPASNIKPLQRKFLRMPVVTYRCCLDGVNDDGKGWTTDQTDYLKALILNQTLVARFDRHNLPEDTYSISLYAPNAACVNDFFLEKEGRPRKSELDLNGDVIQRENLTKRLIINSKASDVASPGMFPNKKSLEQDSFSPSNGYNSPFSPLEMPLCDVLTVGSCIGVKISCIESLQKFWCQMAQSDKKLDVLMKDLQTHYASEHPKPLVESVCVARNPDNNMWYRAKIVTDSQSPDVEVRLIDYGQTKEVPLRDLRPIDPTFLRLDAQAFQCCLFDLPSTDAKEEFQKFVDSGASQNSGLKCVIKAVTSDEEGMLLNVVDIQTQTESATEVLAEKCAKKTTAEPLSDTYCYSNHNIELNTKENVWITSSDTVHHFYCQLDRNSHLFQRVMEDVEKLVPKNTPSEFPLGPENICFARNTDKKWCRGQIIDISSHIKVHIVDYGETLAVNKSNIRPFSSEATAARSVPVLAIPLGLYNVPKVVPQEVNQWFKKVIGNAFTMFVMEKEPNGKLIVELFDGSVSVNAQVREKMVKADAMKVTNVVQDTNQQLFNGSKQGPLSNGDSSPKEEINGEGPDAEKKPMTNSESPLAAPEGVPEKTLDEGKDSSIALEKKHELSSTLLNGEHKTKITQSTPTVSTDRNHSICVYKKPILSINKTEELFASSVSGPEHFWFQCSNTGDLEKVTRLAQKEGQTQQDPDFPKTLVPGSPCLALFSSDNQWYRAQVINRTKDTLSVVFVDYGNEADVNIQHVRPLPPSLQEVAPQAFLCRLDGAEESKDLWDDALYDDFYNLLVDKPLKVKVLFMGHSSEVKVPQYTVQIDDVAVHKLMQKYQKSEDSNVLTKSPQRQNISNVNNVPQNTPSKVSEANMKMCFYRKPNILIDKTVEVYASCISGPGYFWCQYSNTEELENVTRLAQKGGWAEDPVFPESLGPGSPCLALFSSDNQWYRAQVINRSKDTLSVVFIDYGNEADVHINDVRPLPPSLLETPPQAFLCCLYKFDESLGWNDALYDYFHNRLVNKLLKVKVVHMEHNEEIKVPQYSVQFDFDPLFVQKLMKKYSKSKDKVMTKSPQTQNIPQTVQKVSQKTPSNVSEVNVKMCRYNNPKVVMNKTVEVYASSISGPEYFWCQYSNTGELEKVTRLAQKEGQTKQEPNFPKKLVPGSPCLALFSSDNQWYRAQVINRTKDTLSVVFVDYGNEADVNIKHVRPLPPSLQEVAPQAFLCCLDGFEESKGSWDDAVYDELYNVLVDKPLKVTASHSVDNKEMALPQYVVQIQCENTAVNKTMQKYWKSNVKTDNHQAQNSVKSVQNDSKVALTNANTKMYKKPTVSLNRTEEVYASCVVEPHYFWCQFSNSMHLNKIRLAQEAGRSQQRLGTLNPGSPCLALFSSDNQWYRALINKKTGDTLNVLFIDYGNEADADVKDVRSLPQSLLDEAPQAFLCTLHGFDKANGSWDDQIYDDFYNLLVDKPLKIKAITVENNPDVALPQYSVQVECEGADVNKLMEKYWRGQDAEQASERCGLGKDQ